MASRPPTLRRRMALSFGLMVLATVAVGVGAVIAVNGLHADLHVATNGYRQLRQLYDVGFYAARARTAATASPPDRIAAAAAVRSALDALDARGMVNGADGPPAVWVDEPARADCKRLLAAGGGVAFDPLFGRLAQVSADVRRAIAAAESAADARRRAAVRSIAALCAAAAVGAVAVGVHQYRRLVGPVRRLAETTRRFAGGDWDHRLPPAGDAEWVALAVDFNRMADDLQQVYRDLEDRVRTAGRDLARAERLASVGYLAAGVAHEINNPLGIIAGYGELALRQLPPDAISPVDPARLRAALTVMCDEAFRCKRITDQLLSLARPGEAGRSPVRLADIAAVVTAHVDALPVFAGRKVDITVEGDTTVPGNGDELRQVVLNLVVNAIEATTDSEPVGVAVRHVGTQVELVVTDNGRGLSADEAARAFEPFYTTKLAGNRRGTGLGLSVAQAIVTAHGGMLTATSDGPGRGSTFTLRLPAG